MSGIDPTTIQDAFDLVNKSVHVSLRINDIRLIKEMFASQNSLNNHVSQSKIDQLETLRDLEVETYGDTFGPYIVEKIWGVLLYCALFGANRDLLDQESKNLFVLNEDQEICGFLQINWGLGRLSRDG